MSDCLDTLRHLSRLGVTAILIWTSTPAMAAEVVPTPEPASAPQTTAPPIVFQNVTEDSLRKCLFITDDQLRVRCYDDALGRTRAAQGVDAPAAVTTVPGGFLLYQDSRVANSSLLDQRWELDSDSKRGTFQIRPYKPVYLLPYFRTSRVNGNPDSPNPANRVTGPSDLLNNETKFQLSLKTKVWENVFGDNGDVWFAYTQSSRWQVYNSKISRPFRETNYEPEAMFTWRTSWSAFEDATGWSPRMVGLSVNHQSNGRALPLSRSWNRVIGLVGLEKGNTVVQLRPWVRIKEKAADDDNPDILDYVGRGDLLIAHKYRGNEFSLLLRHNLKGGDNARGALQADWGFPVTTSLRGHVQVFSGYGESLIDYNHKATYLGLGLSLVDWF